MAQDTHSRCTPAFPGLNDPFSVLAARALRAGLMRRGEAFLARNGMPSDPGRVALLNRNLLERGIPATGLQPPELAAFFQRWWPVVRGHTFVDRYRAESLLSVLWQAQAMDGDIVECGSYRCGLGFLVAFAVKEWGLRKIVHLYDSFEGLPPLTGEDNAESEETFFFEGQFQFGVDLEHVRTFLVEHDLTGIVELHKGWFDQTLPRIVPEQRFCFAHLDCDLYRSAQTCWTYLMPHMSGGAGVVIDDYDSYGMYAATWEYLAAAGYPLHVGAIKQAHFFVRPGAPSCVGREDWSPLLANRPYCAFLASVCGDMILACSGPPNGPPDERLNAALDRILGPEHKVAFLEHLIAFLYQQA